MPCWTTGKLIIKLQAGMDLEALADAAAAIEMKYFAQLYRTPESQARMRERMFERFKVMAGLGRMTTNRPEYVAEMLQTFTRNVITKAATAYGWQADFQEVDGEMEFTVTRGF